MDRLLLARPQPGTWPASQSCALTGNWTSDLLVHRLALNPLSHSSQGSTLNFKGTSILFPIMDVPIYILTNSVQGSLFAASSSTFVISCNFDNRHLKKCEVLYHCGFDLYFTDNWGQGAPFLVPFGHLFILRNVYSGLLTFLIFPFHYLLV